MAAAAAAALVVAAAAEALAAAAAAAAVALAAAATLAAAVVALTAAVVQVASAATAVMCGGDSCVGVRTRNKWLHVLRAVGRGQRVLFSPVGVGGPRGGTVRTKNGRERPGTCCDGERSRRPRRAAERRAPDAAGRTGTRAGRRPGR